MLFYDGPSAKGNGRNISAKGTQRAHDVINGRTRRHKPKVF